MNRLILNFFILLLLLPFTNYNSHAIDSPLITKDSKADEIQGTFNLILLGGRHINDIETVAILDRVDDQYILIPYAPEFDYKVKKDLPAKDAIIEAEKFISWHSSFMQSQLSKILDLEGNLIGYEVRPLYYPLTFGVSDVLDISYWLKDKQVIVRIELKHSIKKMLDDMDKEILHH